jgi:hypothetical protein
MIYKLLNIEYQLNQSNRSSISEAQKPQAKSHCFVFRNAENLKIRQNLNIDIYDALSIFS